MSRTQFECSPRVEKKIALYVAATAGAFAFVPSVQAQVIFTRTNVLLTHGTLVIDLDHDGTADFTLTDFETSSFYFRGGALDVSGQTGEQPAVLGQGGQGAHALAVPAGIPIGSNSPVGFVPAQGLVSMAYAFNSYNGHGLGGHFANAGIKYLGFQFTLNGQVHYGWARLDVTATIAAFPSVTATLTGYAYESTPNKSIPAGYRGFTDNGEPEGSLGMLSLGAAGRR